MIKRFLAGILVVFIAMVLFPLSAAAERSPGGHGLSGRPKTACIRNGERIYPSMKRIERSASSRAGNCPL